MAGNGARATTLKPEHSDSHWWQALFLITYLYLELKAVKRKIWSVFGPLTAKNTYDCQLLTRIKFTSVHGQELLLNRRLNLFSVLLSQYCYLKVCIYSHGNFEMSFWQSSSQADLSVTGTSSSRHQRPPSGRRGRPSSAPRGGSTKSHIFGISDTPRQEEPKQNARSSFQGNTSSVHTTPEAPRPSSAHAPNNTGGHGAVNNVRMLP